MPSFSSTLFVLTALLSLGYASPAPALDNRQLGSTFNELVSGACRGTTIIYARGTTEAGNVGSVAGPPFFTALGSALGGRSNLAVQGVDYPADVAGFLAGGSRQGISRAAELVRLAQSKCPQTKIVLSGYRYVETVYIFAQ